MSTARPSSPEPPSPAPADAVARRLRDVPVATVVDCLEAHAPDRLVLGGIRAVTKVDGTVAGPARTVRCLPVRQDVPRSPNGPMTVRTIDSLKAGEIVVIDAMGFTGGAVLGDMMAFRAHRQGAAAMVVDGVVRDVAGIEAVGLDVFARGIHPMSGMRRVTPWEADVPIQCGGALVLPGDWIVADKEAVVVVPQGLLHHVLEAIGTTLEHEAFTRGLLERGHPLERVHPLPAALAPYLEGFRRHGQMPSDEELASALAGGSGPAGGAGERRP